MTSLAKIQGLMKDAILDSSLKSSNFLLKHLDQESTRSPSKQISIYRQTVRSNLFFALKDSFPACHATVGENYFKQLSSGYFSKYPPDVADLNKYGDKFSNYLEEIVATRKEASSLIYLGELANLEWHWYLLNFLSKDQEFKLSFKFPVHQIWDLALGHSETKIDLNSGGVKLLFLREEGVRRVKIQNS